LLKLSSCAGCHCHICPRFSQCQGNASSNASSGTGHYCPLSCKWEIALVCHT
jgi:hypothetical protein